MLTGKEILKLNSIKSFLVFFGINIDPISEPERFREALNQLDPRYKGGRDLVRFALEEDASEWSDQQIDTVTKAAITLGMMDPETPLIGHFDLVIVLGGARQSNIDRLRYLLEAIRTGQATVNEIIIAGSTRVLNDAEIENVSNYCADAKTEADLCYAAASSLWLEYGQSYSVMVRGEEKAGNPEVIETVLREVVPLDGSKIAVVTTQIYSMTAWLDLDRVAHRFGRYETVVAGNPSDPALVAKRNTATYLSEILRTLRAALLHTLEVG